MLTKELLDQGIRTSAALRNINRFAALREWLADRGTSVELLDAERADLASEEIDCPVSTSAMSLKFTTSPAPTPLG